MKRKNQIQQFMQLASFIIAVLGFIALTVLVGAKLTGSISPKTFLIYTGIASCILRVDIWWISKNFVNGEWIRKGGENAEP